MLVVNVNNSQKMPLRHFNRSYWRMRRQNALLFVPYIWLSISFFEFVTSVVSILCFISMIFQVRKHNRSARIVAKQIRFNHQVCFKTHHEKSAVIMMGLVIGVFVVCYGMYLRCSFLLLFQTTITSSQCSDKIYKIPAVVLNSAINPLAYAFFKRAWKKELKRLVGAVFKRK